MATFEFVVSLIGQIVQFSPALNCTGGTENIDIRVHQASDLLHICDRRRKGYENNYNDGWW